MNTETTTQTFTNCTLYLKSDLLGNVVKVQCRECEVETGVKFAQYDNATRVRFLGKGKRKHRGTTLTYNPFCVVVEGQDGPNPDDAFNTPVPSECGKYSTSTTRYRAFDDRYVSDFAAKLEASGAKVLFSL